MLVEYVGESSVYGRAARTLASGRRLVLDKDLGQLDRGIVRVQVAEEGQDLGGGAPALISGSALFLEAEGRFFDPALPEEKLLILGGGHVGAALARAADGLGWAITVADDREEFVSRERFAPEVALRLGSYTEAVETFPFDFATYAVILSRGHLFDLECARAALRRECRYVGLIGSRRKVALLKEQLARDGFTDEKIASLHAPIGLDIGAETPAEIAISILAEMIAVRRRVQVRA